MPTYKASKHDDFKKIVSFLKLQRAGSLSLKCFKVRFGDVTEKFLEDMVSTSPRLRLYYVEDETNGVRAVFSVELRGPDFNPKEPKISTLAFACINHDDVVSDNRKYYSEMIDFLVKESVKNEYFQGEFWATAEKAKWSQDLFGDAMTVLREFDHEELGRLYFYVVDFKKYAGV